MLISLIAIDFTFGFGLDYFRTHSRGGETARTEHICNHSDEDILIMGSSRAVHHYNPQIFEDSLGMTCYNCGFDGCGIILAYAHLELILQHYVPKVIVYELTPGFDLSQGDNNRYLKPLRPYADNAPVREVIESVDMNEHYKLFSHLYRYNSIFMKVLGDGIVSRQQMSNGFKPLKKIMEYEPDKPTAIEDSPIDSLKLLYLDRFQTLCGSNNIKLIYTVSPIYKGYVTVNYQHVIDYAMSSSLPFLNHLFDERLINNKEYFYDRTHMNTTGADVYSNIIISEIKNNRLQSTHINL